MMRAGAGVCACAPGAAAAIAATAAILVMTCRREKPQVQLWPAVSAHTNALRFACRMDVLPVVAPVLLSDRAIRSRAFNSFLDAAVGDEPHQGQQNIRRAREQRADEGQSDSRQAEERRELALDVAAERIGQSLV